MTRASASTGNVILLARGVSVNVPVSVEEGPGLAGSVFVAVGVRVGEGKGVPDVVPWQFPVPVSVNVLPASGTNCQS